MHSQEIRLYIQRDSDERKWSYQGDICRGFIAEGMGQVRRELVRYRGREAGETENDSSTEGIGR